MLMLQINEEKKIVSESNVQGEDAPLSSFLALAAIASLFVSLALFPRCASVRARVGDVCVCAFISA